MPTHSSICMHKVLHDNQTYLSPRMMTLYPTLMPRTSTRMVAMRIDRVSSLSKLMNFILAFGIVLRIRSDLMVKLHMSPTLVPDECQGLEYSNSLLSAFTTYK